MMEKLDQWGRRRPSITLAAAVVLAAAATLILLSQSQAPAVLYQAF